MGESKTIKPYQMAFIWGAIWLVILTIVFTVVSDQFSYRGFGRLLAETMLSSAVTGFQAKRSKTAWGFIKIGGVYLVILVIWLIISFL